MFTLAYHPVRPGVGQALFLILLVWAGSMHAAQPVPAVWFPDTPAIRRYVWADQPCPGCTTLSPRPGWSRMAELAGVSNVQFKAASGESGDHAILSPPTSSCCRLPR